jgi:hypothetical protein
LLALIHVFLDNARYHHARLVQECLLDRGAGSSCISFRSVRQKLLDRLPVTGEILRGSLLQRTIRNHATGCAK